MRVRESKTLKNQQMREAMAAIERAQTIFRTRVKVNRAGFVVLDKNAVGDINDELISASRLLWDMRNGY